MYRRLRTWHVLVGTSVLALSSLALVTSTQPLLELGSPDARSLATATEVDRVDHLETGLVVPESSAWEPTGNFRTICQFSHLAHDDPIVYPDQPGASHLHMFFGNTEADATSSFESLRSTGDSTCQGGPLNRSGYWAPAVLDQAGQVVVPSVITVYYKGTGTAEEIQAIEPLPEGLRMIAGHDMETGEGGEHFDWYCEDTQAKSDTIPVCPEHEQVGVVLAFPMCWDGHRHDAPDHRSHMAYKERDPHTGDTSCPDSHPIHVPEFTLGIWFEHDGHSDQWHLSSDRMPRMQDHPNGSTFHSDWFGAWDPETIRTWTDECIRAMRNCIAGELGDGTRLADVRDHRGPRRIELPVRP